MATLKEEAQAKREAQNERAQKAQDAFGAAAAGVRVGKGEDAAEATRKAHAAELAADQEWQNQDDK